MQINTYNNGHIFIILYNWSHFKYRLGVVYCMVEVISFCTGLFDMQVSAPKLYLIQQSFILSKFIGEPMEEVKTVRYW